jgi:hypothetical protein
VALIDDHMNFVDSVAYGPVVSTHNFIETAHAPLPPTVSHPGKVIARSPNGVDTDDNSADFVIATPTPRAKN